MATDLSATTTITFEQLTKYFHLPINDVAKELGICATMLKKICRKNGIPRWPHRKIKSLNKMIENLEASLQNNASEAEECIRQEINILKNKKSLIMKNPSILVQGNKRASQDADGKVVKKLRSEDDMPVATVTVPRSLLTPSSSSSSSSLSINQLLTPSNPFSTPLTSYLMAGEDKDEKESPRRGDEIQMMRPPSPNTQHYYKTSVQQSPMQQAASRYYLPQEYSHRAGTDYLSQPSYVQQPTSTSQDSHYVLPKLNFSSNNATQPTTSYMTSSPPKFRPPSPINSSHQLQHQQPSYAPASPDSYSRHYFHHYHPQLSSPATPYKMQYSQPQQPQQSQQVAMPQQMIAQQSASGAPVVLRWVMEYDKSKK